MRGRFFLSLTAAVLSGCAGVPRAVAPAPQSRTGPAAARPASPPDVHFLSGMIAHHAQAVLMAGWAPTRGASPSVRSLCERIVVGQRDEIALMQTWLADHGQPVPSATDTRMHMSMGGMQHDMLMPGMLSDEQMAELDASRGAEFDRLFMTYMIQHHEGALMMVNELFASAGAAQDDVVYKMASDIYADQTTEIERMQRMLSTQP